MAKDKLRSAPERSVGPSAVTIRWLDGQRIIEPSEFIPMLESSPASRLWELGNVVAFLVVQSPRARGRFIRILTAYSRAVSSQASAITITEVHLWIAFSTHLKRGRYSYAFNLLVSLFGHEDDIAKLIGRKLNGRPNRARYQRSVPAERRALVLLHHGLRAAGDASDLPLNTLQDRLAQLMVAPSPVSTDLQIQRAIAVADQLAKSHQRVRQGKVGRSTNLAQKKLLACLALFYRQNGKRPVMICGSFSTPFLDFLDAVNCGLRDGVKEINDTYPTWSAIHLPVGLPFSANRKATIAALRVLNPGQRRLLGMPEPQ